MPKYIVTVIKTDTYSTEIEIEAETLAQAESMAEDDAREKDLDWSYEGIRMVRVRGADR
jgi:hypothetical protein